MDLYFYSKRLDVAAISLADLRLLVAALDDELDPTNAATIARITAKLPSLVQSDVAEPVRLYCYDDAGTNLSSWVTDAAVTVTVGLGAPNAETTGDYSTATAAISGSSRLASLVLNTQALARALSGRRGATLYLQVRQAPANGGETVLRLPLQVLPGVISSPTNEDNAADVSAAATSAAAAAASAAAASSSAATALASQVAAASSASAADTDAATAAAAAVSTAADAVSTAADAAQTAADNIAASASAAASAASAAAAAASQTAAASSATSAAGAVASQYLGGVAGASVPATATAAGYYYRITSVGTSQSKTWAVGDMAIYNGTSGSWTQLSGILPYATAAQARTGTDTTSALNSSTGNERALLGDLTRLIRDALYSDGTTSNRRAEWVPGTAGAVAALPISIPFDFQVPSSNPTSNAIIFQFAPTAADHAGTAECLTFFIGAADSTLYLQERGTPSSERRLLSLANFRTTYSGQWIRGMVVFASGNSSTDPTIYINGVAVTFTSSATSSPPNWMASSLVTTLFHSGFQLPAGRFMPRAPILGALTAAEVLEWTQTGRLPAWAEVGTGSAVAQTSGTLTIGRKYRINSYVASDSFTNVGAGSNATGVEFVATGTTPTTWTNSSQLLALGPIIKPVIQPIPVLADNGTNKIAGILTSGITPITEKRDWIIQASTSTNGNQQLLGTSVFTDATKAVLDDWCMNTAGTPTVTAGSASAGTQYKASGALTATRNMITLVTRVLASVNLWCGSNDTSTIQHTVRGHMVD